jgi:glycerol kinase
LVVDAGPPPTITGCNSSDVLGHQLKFRMLETTAWRCLFGRLAVKYWTSLEQIKPFIPIARLSIQKMPEAEVAQRYQGWKQAVAATRMFKPDRR